MVQKLHIQNFKSIRDLKLECKRVNLFIGEPNAGKSNIIEALSLQALQQTLSFEGLVRFSDLSNLFSENDPSNRIVVECDKIKTEIFYEKGNVNLVYQNGSDPQLTRTFSGGFNTTHFNGQGARWDSLIHPYFFRMLKNFPELNYDYLSVPHGDNLFFLLQTNKMLRNLISDFVQERGFKLTLRQASNEIEISKEENSILTSYPYTIISDTLQRVIFYLTAIETNKKGSTLLFEEPESNVFPYYTKYLAERISMDEKQFFMTTHNPYFLLSIIEKTPIDSIGVNVVKMNSKFETEVMTLTDRGVEEVLNLGSDVFLNFDKLIEA